MFRKLLILLIAVLLTVTFSDLSWGSLANESFGATGTAKLKISVKRAGSASDTEAWDATFDFDGNGPFQLEGTGLSGEAMIFSGPWTQVKKKFTVNLSYEDLQNYMDDVLDFAFYEALVAIGCGSPAADASNVTLTKYSFTGTESKDGSTIKGKFSFTTSFNLYLYCDGTSVNTTGKTTFTISFAGSKSGLSSEADAISDDSRSFAEMLGDAVADLFSRSGAEFLR